VTEQYKTASDKFDRALGSLTGMPDVAKTQPTTIRAAAPITGDGQTFIIQTFRRREEGDTIFVEYMDSAGSLRLVIPPAAADAIARQRDSLTTKNRKRAAKEVADARKARGELPAFLNGHAKKRKKSRAAQRVVPVAAIPDRPPLPGPGGGPADPAGG
jgi:hypothetical protein